MDLYEALKAGSSYEDLLSGFRAELDEASAKLEQEKEAERAEEEAAIRDEYLSECRDCLADALIDYVEALYDADQELPEFSFDLVVETLKDYEKDVKRMIEISQKLERAKEKNPNLKINMSGFNDLMDEFLKVFKQF